MKFNQVAQLKTWQTIVKLKHLKKYDNSYLS